MITKLWKGDDHYFQELNSFAQLVDKKFPDGKITCLSYSGGVPGMQCQLRSDRYHEAELWLIGQFGVPTLKAHWHPSQTRKLCPLEFKKTAVMVPGKMFHVNLISMMQRPHKRYTIITWM